MTETLEASPAQDTPEGGPVFTVDPAALKDAVGFASRALSPRPPSPVMSGLKITAEDGQITVTGSDYDRVATATVEADVTEPGEVLVSGRIVGEIAANLPKKPVTVDNTGQQTTIKAGRSKYQINRMPLDQYPQPPAAPETVGTMDGTTLAGVIARAAKFTSDDQSKPELACIHLQFTDRLTVTATDRYRLFTETTEWDPEDEDTDLAALVDTKALVEATKPLAGAGLVTIGLDEDRISFDAGNRTASINLKDGQFPRIRQFFDLDYTSNTADVSTGEMVDAVRRVRIADQDTNGRIHLTVKDQALVVGAVSQAAEQAAEIVDVDATGDLTVAYNPAYVADALGVIPTARTRFGFQSDMRKPVMVTGVTEDGDTAPGAQVILMPVRVK